MSLSVCTHQPIEAFGISGGETVSEVVKNGISIVLNGQSEGQESIRDFWCDLCKPGEVLLQGVILCRCFIDAVKGFLKAIGGFQTREVLEPCFKDQGFALAQVMRASQQQEPIMHQGSTLLVCE